MINTPLQALTIRPSETTDLAAINAINNAYNVDAPQPLASREHHERSRNPALPFHRLVAERAGQVVGVGWCGWDGNLTAPDCYDFSVTVVPEHTGQGIGRRLSAALIGWARQQGAQWLICGCSAGWPRSRHFLQQAGFQAVGQRYELALALDSFDERPFADALTRIAAQGIILTTLGQERRPDAVERLYRLAYPLLCGIPLPRGLVLDMSFSEWCATEIDAPDASPDTIVIAKRGDEYIGYSNLRLVSGGPAYTMMTGVRSDAQRHGVALALKLQTIWIARAHGYHEMRTNNDTANPGILTLNKRLGYTALPAWLIWEKKLTDEH